MTKPRRHPRRAPFYLRPNHVGASNVTRRPSNPPKTIIAYLFLGRAADRNVENSWTGSSESNETSIRVVGLALWTDRTKARRSPGTTRLPRRSRHRDNEQVRRNRICPSRTRYWRPRLTPVPITVLGRRTQRGRTITIMGRRCRPRAFRSSRPATAAHERACPPYSYRNQVTNGLRPDRYER